MAWRVPPGPAAALIHALYRPWCASLRLTCVNQGTLDALRRAGTPCVFVAWHNECFTILSLREHNRVTAVASQSRDGAYISGVLERLGYAVARGSSSRGGAGALLACVRRMKEEGFSTAITLDGPRGPRHQAKDGAIFLAHQTGAPLLPMRALPERCFRFKSWDRFELPLPFSAVRVICGNPYRIEREFLDDAALAEERDRLNRAMRDLETLEEKSGEEKSGEENL